MWGLALRLFTKIIESFIYTQFYYFSEWIGSEISGKTRTKENKTGTKGKLVKIFSGMFLIILDNNLKCVIFTSYYWCYGLMEYIIILY